MGWFSKLFSSTPAAPKRGETETIEGYRVTPEPMPRDGQFQTAGLIESGDGETLQTHRFIRADLHPTFEQACSHSVQKAEQIIREQGARLFS